MWIKNSFENSPVIQYKQIFASMYIPAASQIQKMRNYLSPIFLQINVLYLYNPVPCIILTQPYPLNDWWHNYKRPLQRYCILWQQIQDYCIRSTLVFSQSPCTAYQKMQEDAEHGFLLLTEKTLIPKTKIRIF